MNCLRCDGTGRVRGFRWYWSGVMDLCPLCQPPAPKLPPWLKAEGHSILHPMLKDSDGGAMEVKGQT